jgi:hypothetical protein
LDEKMSLEKAGIIADSKIFVFLEMKREIEDED